MGAAFSVDIFVNGKKRPKGALFDLKEEAQELVKGLKKDHIIVSKEALMEEQRLGFDKKPRVRVDNRFDAPEENVKPFGKIEYFARTDLKEAILSAFLIIEQRSPQVSGKYKSSNYVYYNNNIVAQNYNGLKFWLDKVELKDGSAIRFVNIMPYASRLEFRGITSKNTKGVTKFAKRKKNSRYIFAKVPHGTYYVATSAIRRRFKAAANLIKFSFINGSYIKIPKKYGMRTVYHPSNKKHKGAYVYPSIVFNISSKGIL